MHVWRDEYSAVILHQACRNSLHLGPIWKKKMTVKFGSLSRGGAVKCRDDGRGILERDAYENTTNRSAMFQSEKAAVTTSSRLPPIFFLLSVSFLVISCYVRRMMYVWSYLKEAKMEISDHDKTTLLIFLYVCSNLKAKVSR